MKKKKQSHPNKLGVVGRKKLSKADKKSPVRIYFEQKEIDERGGLNAVKAVFLETFENKENFLKEN